MKREKDKRVWVIVTMASTIFFTVGAVLFLFSWGAYESNKMVEDRMYPEFGGVKLVGVEYGDGSGRLDRIELAVYAKGYIDVSVDRIIQKCDDGIDDGIEFFRWSGSNEVVRGDYSLVITPDVPLNCAEVRIKVNVTNYYGDVVFYDDSFILPASLW